MILAIRTDRPEAELYLLQNSKVKDKLKWHAHRELADTLLMKIKELVEENNIMLEELQGIIVFTGEGSFTGLRIGTTVANGLAYSLNIPVVTASGSNWLKTGQANIQNAKLGALVIPEYNSAPNISTPKRKKLQLEDKSK